MVELSPQAHEILKAAYKATRNPQWQTNFYSSYAAAVLRTAAQQLRTAYANEEYVDSADDYLDDIANELEKTTVQTITLMTLPTSWRKLMTDLTPNDLSHLSDEKFNALCPQGYHAPGPAEPLSPAAQAVLNAAINAAESPDAEAIAAAALRAASRFVSAIEVEAGDELLAIAAELEGKCNG